jgi:hypothetical protein
MRSSLQLATQRAERRPPLTFRKDHPSETEHLIAQLSPRRTIEWVSSVFFAFQSWQRLTAPHCHTAVNVLTPSGAIAVMIRCGQVRPPRLSPKTSTVATGTHDPRQFRS